jgi:hypothetical protein
MLMVAVVGELMDKVTLVETEDAVVEQALHQILYQMLMEIQAEQEIDQIHTHQYKDMVVVVVQPSVNLTAALAVVAAEQAVWVKVDLPLQQ